MNDVPVPQTVGDVTPDWLSSALSAHDGRAVEVTGLALDRIGTGQAGSTYRVVPTYSDGAGLPATLVMKLPAEDPALRAALALGYRSEIAFYDKVAGAVRTPIPRCFYCGINAEGTDFALILSDLHPMVQGDQIGGCSAAEARLVVEALAGVHGPTWCDPRWLELPEVAMPKPGDTEAAAVMGDVAVTAVGLVLDRLGHRLTPDDHDTLRAAMARVRPWLADQPRYSLMHGDFRADNIMFDPDGSGVTLVDWQTIGVGMPTRDLAYFTGSSLTTPMRRRIERGLVELYHSTLLSHGVAGYSLETCWRDYCAGLIQGPLISILGCAFATATERGDDMFVTTLQRSAVAIREMGTLNLIGS